MDEKLFEKKIESKKIFNGEIVGLYFDKVRLPNNKIAMREKVTHPGAVGIVPVNKNGDIILVRQYRYPVGKVIIEIPAGKLSKKESPLECARRELREEVGAIGGKLIHLSTFYTTPGFCNEILHLYIAIDFKNIENDLDDDEFLHIITVKIDDCIRLVESGEIKDAKTIIGILMARDYLNKEFKADG
jgi:ADP-ribose pyrophosphatase